MLHDKHSNPILMEITAADDLNVALIGQEVTCKEIVIPEKYYPIKTNLKVSCKKYSYLSLTLSFPLPNSEPSPSSEVMKNTCFVPRARGFCQAPSKCSSPLTSCVVGGTTGSSLLHSYLAAKNLYIPKGLLRQGFQREHSPR